MGDRANVYICENLATPGVYLYSHWGGHDLPKVVQRALRRKLRWYDVSYLARIVFCEMVKGHEADETGFGIAAYPPDNEHKLIVLETEGMLVHITDCPFDASRVRRAGKTFADFCELPEAHLDEYTGRA